MHEYLKNHTFIALQLFIIAGAIVIGAGVAAYKTSHIEKALVAQIVASEKNMFDLAVITDRNGADETIERIVSDCPRRSEYDALLGSLATLTKKDLVTLQTLDESCGNFFKERKALMVSKLESQLHNYRELLVLLELLGDVKVLPHDLQKWETLVEHEKKRSQLLTEQSSLQEQIISKLLAGVAVNGAEVRMLVTEAQEINDLLGVQDRTIDVLRETLNP